MPLGGSRALPSAPGIPINGEERAGREENEPSARGGPAGAASRRGSPVSASPVGFPSDMTPLGTGDSVTAPGHTPWQHRGGGGQRCRSPL